MKLPRPEPVREAETSCELDLVDCVEVAAALQAWFPELGAYDLLRGAFALLEGRLALPEAALH